MAYDTKPQNAPGLTSDKITQLTQAAQDHTPKEHA